MPDPMSVQRARRSCLGMAERPILMSAPPPCTMAICVPDAAARSVGCPLYRSANSACVARKKSPKLMLLMKLAPTRRSTRPGAMATEACDASTATITPSSTAFRPRLSTNAPTAGAMRISVSAAAERVLESMRVAFAAPSVRLSCVAGTNVTMVEAIMNISDVSCTGRSEPLGGLGTTSDVGESHSEMLQPPRRPSTSWRC